MWMTLSFPLCFLVCFTFWLRLLRRKFQNLLCEPGFQPKTTESKVFDDILEINTKSHSAHLVPKTDTGRLSVGQTHKLSYVLMSH